MVRLLQQTTLLAGVAALLAACCEPGYYAQAVRGHLELMRLSRPIAEVLTDPQLSANRRLGLTTIVQVRDFASQKLGLPENGSYRTFADLGRPYAVWNVVDAPEFSLEPRRWCFPVAGCVSYRGYFREQAGRDEAARLGAEGFDTDLYGVSAYSTLRWFDDPVLNTFVDGPPLRAQPPRARAATVIPARNVRIQMCFICASF